jgi:hypothetical protein
MRTAALNRSAAAGLSLLAVWACGPGGEPASGAGPDGALAFNTIRDGNYEVYVMPAEGGAARNVTADTSVDWPMTRPTAGPTGPRTGSGSLSTLTGPATTRSGSCGPMAPTPAA